MAVIFIVMLLFVLIVRALRMIPTLSTHHELNKALDYVVENWKAGGLLYIRFDDSDAYRFCKWRYDFTPNTVIVEETPSVVPYEESKANIKNLRDSDQPQRVWFTLVYDSPDIV